MSGTPPSFTAPAFGPARRLVAEALGTALLLAIVVGSGIMAERLTGDVALALLANTVATGAGLVALIAIFGPISGAHFNPAVTLVFALKRELSTRIAAAYAATQIVGGVAGVWLAHLMFAEPVIQLSTKLRDGPAQALSEGVATFGLVGVILAGVRFRPQAVPALVDDARHAARQAFFPIGLAGVRDHAVLTAP